MKLSFFLLLLCQAFAFGSVNYSFNMPPPKIIIRNYTGVYVQSVVYGLKFPEGESKLEAYNHPDLDLQSQGGGCCFGNYTIDNVSGDTLVIELGMNASHSVINPDQYQWTALWAGTGLGLTVFGFRWGRRILMQGADLSIH